MLQWAEVAQLRGISRKDNAATAFKAMMKKLGMDYSNNKFTLIDPAAMAAGTEPKTPKTPKTSSPRKRKPKASDQDGDEDKGESASPKKKARARKVVEKEQVNEETKVEAKDITDEDEAE